MKVYLRERINRTGSTTLYLDFYSNGKRTYKYLNLHLIKPKTSLDRDVNKQTMMQAERLRAQYQLDIQSMEHGFAPPSSKRIDYIEYFAAEVEKRYNQDLDHASWSSTLIHLKKFIGKERVMISSIDEGWLERCKEYLLYEAKKKNGEKISHNSAHHYFNRVLNSFKIAFRDKVIEKDPGEKVDYINQKETKREFLTIEELQSLVKTDCRFPVLKQAFLFSCLTGLRWSDIYELTWSEVQFTEKNGWGFILLKRKPTEWNFFRSRSKQENFFERNVVNQMKRFLLI